MTTPTVCPEGLRLQIPVPTVVVRLPADGRPIERVCVEDASGNAETYVLAPPADADTTVQLSTGEPIVAYSVNAEWPTLPVTGESTSVIVLAVVTFVVGLGFGKVGRRR